MNQFSTVYFWSYKRSWSTIPALLTYIFVIAVLNCSVLKIIFACASYGSCLYAKLHLRNAFQAYIWKSSWYLNFKPYLIQFRFITTLLQPCCYGESFTVIQIFCSKEISFCHNLRCSDPYILCRPLIFQTLIILSNRIQSLKYPRSKIKKWQW